ncbi:MAG: hypothetical protein AAFP89_26485 [Bacteroidota bacterium]
MFSQLFFLESKSRWIIGLPALLMLMLVHDIHLVAQDTPASIDSSTYKENPVAELLQQKEWIVFRVIEIQSQRDSTDVTDTYLKECDKDDFIEYSNNGTYNRFQGNTKCEGLENEVAGYGEWKIIEGRILEDRYQGGRRTRKFIESIQSHQLTLGYSAQGGIYRKVTYRSREAIDDPEMVTGEEEETSKAFIPVIDLEGPEEVKQFEIVVPDHHISPFAGEHMEYPDAYQNIYFNIGSRKSKTTAYEATVSILDESGRPATYTLSDSISANRRNASLELGFAYGDFTNIHTEVSASWSFGDISTKSLGVGVGYNRSLAGGRYVARGIMGLHYLVIGYGAGDMELAGVNQTNIRINNTDFFNDVEVNIRRRAIEFRPRFEFLVRVIEGLQVKAHIGYNLPLAYKRGFIHFRGTEDEVNLVERQNTSQNNITIQGGDQRFLDYQGTGIIWGIGINYNIVHSHYSLK